MRGKTIRLFLVDGNAAGLLTAEIMNWTGKALVCPRSQLLALADRDEARKTGLYALVGPDPEKPARERVYIGESDNVFDRLRTHDKDVSKDFWTRTVLVTSKDENLTKSHTLYLESRLIEMTRDAGRAVLANGTEPSKSLPESDRADMEFFLEQFGLVLPVLGFTFTQPISRVDGGGVAPGTTSSPLFVIQAVGISARARQVGDEFVVLKNSTARREGVPSWTSYKSLREQLVEDGSLVPSPQPEYLSFLEDTPFSSPSAAASVVQARNSNGRLDWKVEGTTTTYQSWSESMVEQALDGNR